MGRPPPDCDDGDCDRAEHFGLLHLVAANVGHAGQSRDGRAGPSGAIAQPSQDPYQQQDGIEWP